MRLMHYLAGKTAGVASVQRLPFCFCVGLFWLRGSPYRWPRLVLLRAIFVRRPGSDTAADYLADILVSQSKARAQMPSALIAKQVMDRQHSNMGNGTPVGLEAKRV
jgi:hypothetical protein